MRLLVSKIRALRSVEASQIGGARSGLVEIDAVDRLGFAKQFPRLFEKGSGLAFHRSIPSARIAYISGMRGSLYEPSG